MKDLMLVFANALPEEAIIDGIEKGIIEYKNSADKKEGRDKIKMYSLLLLSKDAIDKDKDGVLGMMKKFDDQQKAYNLITNT